MNHFCALIIETEKEGMGNEILEELKDYFKKYEKMEI
jgi:phosphoglucomutase/phosphomannomutase family protein